MLQTYTLGALFNSQVKTKLCHTGHDDSTKSFTCMPIVCTAARARIVGVCSQTANIPSVSHQVTCPLNLPTGGAPARQRVKRCSRIILSLCACCRFYSKYNIYASCLPVSILKFHNIVGYVIYVMTSQYDKKSLDLLLFSFIFIT